MLVTLKKLTNQNKYYSPNSRIYYHIDCVNYSVNIKKQNPANLICGVFYFLGRLFNHEYINIMLLKKRDKIISVVLFLSSLWTQNGIPHCLAQNQFSTIGYQIIFLFTGKAPLENRHRHIG